MTAKSTPPPQENKTEYRYIMEPLKLVAAVEASRSFGHHVNFVRQSQNHHIQKASDQHSKDKKVYAEKKLHV